MSQDTLQQVLKREAARRRLRNLSKVWAIRAAIVLAFAIAWKAITLFGFVNPVFVGTPEGTVSAFFTQLVGPGNIWIDIGYTVTATLIGFAIGATVGVIGGSLLYQYPALRTAVSPLIVAANSLPRVALAPLFILWFGLGIPGKVALVFSFVFFVMMTTTLAGLTQPNRDHEYLSKSLGASKLQHILLFVAPAAVPTILAGLELSLTYSFLGTVSGEIVGGAHGVGVRLTAFANSFEINKFMALLLFLVIVSTITVQVLRRYTRSFTKWHAVEQSQQG